MWDGGTVRRRLSSLLGTRAAGVLDGKDPPEDVPKVVSSGVIRSEDNRFVRSLSVLGADVGGEESELDSAC